MVVDSAKADSTLNDHIPHQTRFKALPALICQLFGINLIAGGWGLTALYQAK